MKLRILSSALTIAALWIAAVFLVAASALNDHVFVVPANLRALQVAFLPEGWAFFTKSPREKQLSLYSLHEGEAPMPVNLSENRAHLFSSFNRVDRARLTEVSSVLQRLPPSMWQNCEGGLDECLSSLSGEKILIKNNRLNAEICGDYVLALSEPVPWAWARLTKKGQMPASAVKITIECPGQTIAKAE
jgi:antimicrobial peptide system SdpA family protein